MRVLKSSGAEIVWSASPAVRDLVASLGRSEDLRFSPNNRRLAVAGFSRSRIAVFDIDITKSAAQVHVTLTAGVELSSAALSLPHGLDFIDDETLVVANRACDVAIFRLPPGTADPHSCDIAPIQTIPVGGPTPLRAPSSVSVVGDRGDQSEVLICNNAGNDVTRHRLDRAAGCAVISNEVLLRKWFDVPDGVGASHDRRWLAISDHESHRVLLYDYSKTLGPNADPDGILRGIYYPHGVRFSSDDRYLFVADAGSPFVLVYTPDEEGWRGVRYPLARIRIMDDSLFSLGHGHPAEGGPKGIDIDAGQNVLAVAGEHRPLAFFNLPAILSKLDVDSSEQSRREDCAAEVHCDLMILQLRNEAHSKAIGEVLALAGYMNNSKSWRLTAPLRRLDSVLRRLR